MALIGEQIRKQMQLTAALMSDPTLLRTEPSVVASSFAATLKKIDMLQVYLRPREGLPTPRCDASLIIDGVKQAVYLTMDKQMMPLKGPLPSIVQNDLQGFYNPNYANGEVENLAEREIKETNCMAAMVLAQYYLKWHVVLIMINQLDSPFRDENADKDLEELKSLPTFLDLLEYRHLKNHFRGTGGNTAGIAKWTALLKAKVTSGMMLNKPHSNTFGGVTSTRASKAVEMYQQALSLNIGRFQTAFSADASDLIKDIKNEIHQTTAMLTGGVLTTMQLQDETQIWKDMQTLTNVVSTDMNANQTRYSYILQEVLSNRPYFDTPAEFLTRCAPLCVYHFNSTLLMADICVSLKRITAFIAELQNEAGAATYSRALTEFVYRGIVLPSDLETALVAELKHHEKTKPPAKHFVDFIGETANNARMRNGKLGYRLHITVDDITGYYVSKGGFTSLDRSNHVYLAHHSVLNAPAGTASFVTRMQNALDGTTVDTADCAESVSAATKNSLFTTYCVKSAIGLLDRVKTHPLFSESAGKYRHGGIAVDRPLLAKRLTDEQKAFKEVCDRFTKVGLGRYPKYAGISWPVDYTYTDTGNPATGNNTNIFSLDGYVPRIIRGTQYELVKGVVDIADGANMMKVAAGYQLPKAVLNQLAAFTAGGVSMANFPGNGH